MIKKLLHITAAHPSTTIPSDQLLRPRERSVQTFLWPTRPHIVIKPRIDYRHQIVIQKSVDHSVSNSCHSYIPSFLFTHDFVGIQRIARLGFLPRRNARRLAQKSVIITASFLTETRAPLSLSAFELFKFGLPSLLTYEFGTFDQPSSSTHGAVRYTH